MGFWRKFQKDYGKEKVFFRSTKWIMERVKGFVCFCVGFKGFIKDYGKRKGKRKKLWKRMPTLAQGLKYFQTISSLFDELIEQMQLKII